MTQRTLLSLGDFLDLSYKVRQKGLGVIKGLLHFSGQGRTASKWNEHIVSGDFWIIPEVRQRWNEDCTGDKDLGYEDYVMAHHLKDRKGLRMLSIGCGTGARERTWGKYPQFERIDGIDVATEQIERAREEADMIGMKHLHYFAADFTRHHFEHAPYDVILFNSSLHHFDNINSLLPQHVLPKLAPGGLVVVFEYAGPNRLQWTDAQLAFANEVLLAIPQKYRVRFQSQSIKSKIYRPGVWRVKLIDPSEAVDSEDLVPALHRHLEIVEEHRVRFDIAHLVLKDIAHHFLEKDDEANKWLQYVFAKEDEFCSRTGSRDIVFGVYRQKIN
jgi:ubiquinone/menaquinone biosynthesis C-methylase UbiE